MYNRLISTYQIHPPNDEEDYHDSIYPYMSVSLARVSSMLCIAYQDSPESDANATFLRSHSPTHFVYGTHQGSHTTPLGRNARKHHSNVYTPAPMKSESLQHSSLCLISSCGNAMWKCDVKVCASSQIVQILQTEAHSRVCSDTLSKSTWATRHSTLVNFTTVPPPCFGN